jgi:2'-hydroxyisoflavone reductase
VKLLVLGGTVFVSRAIAVTAVRRGHEVTCAHRGRSGLGPTGVTDVVLDRDEDGDGGIAALADHRYDAVVDVATQDPGWVADAIALLGGSTGHWTFVSSVSAYADAATPGQDAGAERVPPLDDDTPADEHYARAKRSSEDVVLQAVGEKAFVVRPGLVVGPGDPTDRYGYWPARFTRGGPVLVPDVLDAPTQVLDVDDLAAWVVTAAEHRLVAQLDAVGRPRPLGEVLDESSGTGAELVAVSQARLAELDVRPWSGPRSLPLWVPQPEMAGFGARDVSASLAAGLVLRPLAETARRVLAHERVLGLDRERRSGLSRADEQHVLRALG